MICFSCISGTSAGHLEFYEYTMGWGGASASMSNGVLIQFWKICCTIYLCSIFRDTTYCTAAIFYNTPFRTKQVPFTLLDQFTYNQQWNSLWSIQMSHVSCSLDGLPPNFPYQCSLIIQNRLRNPGPHTTMLYLNFRREPTVIAQLDSTSIAPLNQPYVQELASTIQPFTNS